MSDMGAPPRQGPEADPTCPVCSKPVKAGSLVVSRHGEVVHVRCVTEVLDSKAVQQANRAATLLERMTQFPTCVLCHEPIRGDYVRRQNGKAVHVNCSPPPIGRQRPPA
jgi:hypothetical protein